MVGMSAEFMCLYFFLVQNLSKHKQFDTSFFEIFCLSINNSNRMQIAFSKNTKHVSDVQLKLL